MIFVDADYVGANAAASGSGSEDCHSDDGLKWTDPKIVKKDNGEVETIHIVRHQVDHLAYSCLAKCFLA